MNRKLHNYIQKAMHTTIKLLKTSEEKNHKSIQEKTTTTKKQQRTVDFSSKTMGGRR